MKKPNRIVPADGKLGVLIPGMGAVATTFIAGAMLARKRLAEPFGSLTQLGNIRLGKRTEGRQKLLREFVPLASLDSLVFGGWDLFHDDAYQAARNAEVLTSEHLNAVKDELSAVKPMPAVFFPEYVKRLRGENVKSSTNKRELADAVRDDIKRFKRDNGVDRCRRGVVWLDRGASRADRGPSIGRRRSSAAWNRAIPASARRWSTRTR